MFLKMMAEHKYTDAKQILSNILEAKIASRIRCVTEENK